MQRSPSLLIFRIHIRTSGQVLFNNFDVPVSGGMVN